MRPWLTPPYGPQNSFNKLFGSKISRPARSGPRAGSANYNLDAPRASPFGPPMTQPNHMLAIGHGYSSRALQTILPGWTYTGTNRSGEAALAWPGTDLLPHIAAATHILISAAPTDEGDPFLKDYAAAITEHATRLSWVGYLSTTGVYGDHQGGWVDETTPLTPSTKRGKARQQAEAQWQAIADLPLHIFRLAGIYGPGRGPFSKVRKGTAKRIIKKNQIFSRIHVEDIAQTLKASIAQPNPGAIYNLCDDDPQPPEVVIEYAAKLLDKPVPPAVPFEEAEMTPMARSFYAESKRVSNARIKSELGVRLIYPSYKDGLKAILAAQAQE